MFISSILAGLAIGIACILYCIAPNPIIGAGLFAIGLLAVRIMKTNLFTGKIQYLGKSLSFSDMCNIFSGNIFGIFIILLLAHFCFPTILPVAANIGATKIAVPLIQTFGKAILCGYIMTLATKPDTPLWVSAVCVFAFVYSGLNHCIADAFYYGLADSSLNKILPFWITVLGNIIGGRVGGI
jgi:formate/nitrite transporter FocA (FNT family)